MNFFIPREKVEYFFFAGSQEAYIADSESSSIRSLDLKTGGSRLIAGGDPMFAENLFRVFIPFGLLLLSVAFQYFYHEGG